MKESRLNYQVKRPKVSNGGDGEKQHHVSSRSKMEIRQREVRKLDRAIRSKDYRALLEDID
jgi:hypothetical protein